MASRKDTFYLNPIRVKLAIGYKQSCKKDIAEVLGTSVSSVRRWLSGDIKVTLETAIKLGNYLGVPPAILMEDEYVDFVSTSYKDIMVSMRLLSKEQLYTIANTAVEQIKSLEEEE